MLIPKAVLEVARVASSDYSRQNLANVLFNREGGLLRATATDGHRLITATFAELDHEELRALYGEPAERAADFRALLNAPALLDSLKLTRASKRGPAGWDVNPAAFIAVTENGLNGTARLLSSDGACTTERQIPTGEIESFPNWAQVMPAAREDIAEWLKLQSGFLDSDQGGRDRRRERLQTLRVRVGVNASYLAETCAAVRKAAGGSELTHCVELEVSADACSPIVIRCTGDIGSAVGLVMPCRI